MLDSKVIENLQEEEKKQEEIKEQEDIKKAQKNINKSQKKNKESKKVKELKNKISELEDELKEKEAHIKFLKSEQEELLKQSEYEAYKPENKGKYIFTCNLKYNKVMYTKGQIVDEADKHLIKNKFVTKIK